MRFTSDSILPLEIMNLHVIFENEVCSKTILGNFIMVDIPSAYNAIIGPTHIEQTEGVNVKLLHHEVSNEDRH